MNCPIHPQTTLICPSCMAARNKGVTSTRKARSSRRNGKKAHLAKQTASNTRLTENA